MNVLALIPTTARPEVHHIDRSDEMFSYMASWHAGRTCAMPRTCHPLISHH